MTSFFPDVNVWLALTDEKHSMRESAWSWFGSIPPESRVIFSRFTQLGFLRLLTNQSVMGPATMVLGHALAAMDEWFLDPRVEFSPEPRGLDQSLRQFLDPFAAKPASQWIGDCYLLAFAELSHSRLVTFDQALYRYARKAGHRAVLPE
jgi:toxin-antitoxin system PIN domain toxin